ncbi:MAG: cation:proton antiporter [Phycisphaerales bacterium]|nr:MAG: cation:proton antiporter [Phycisphaerales bacterium]
MTTVNSLFGTILAQSKETNVLLLVGVGICAGAVGAKLVQMLHIPKIVGYILIGVILGPACGIISADAIHVFEPFNSFALGVIGFLIGGELKRDIFTKFGKQVFAILLFEGGVAFLLVTILSFLALWYTHEWHQALAIAVVFGAICAATDPASTVNVLWEYKTRGPLTTLLTAIVALDDALALVLYITSVSLANFLTGHQDEGLLTMIGHSFYEVFGSLALGVGIGTLLNWAVRRTDEDDRTLIYTISGIVLSIGLALALELDTILSSMACGVTLVNLSPRRSTRSFDVVHRITPPIYVLFFVMIGARLNIHLSGLIALLAGVYIIGSVIGKTSGSYFGAAYSKAVPSVKKYLGFCLYQQGTIAIALLIMASQRFEGQTRETMLSVIVAGVFILQFVGPLCTKIGVRKAGEMGMNVTEEDLIKIYTVGDVMDKDVPVMAAGTPLSEVIQIVSQTRSTYYSVVDAEEKIVGAITMDGIRSTFATQELNDWLVALDIVEPLIATTTPTVPLSQAMETMRELNAEQLPVVTGDNGDRYVGILDERSVLRRLSAEVLAKQKEADSMYKPVAT